MVQTVGTSNFLYFFLFEGLKEPLANASGQPDGQVGPYETLLSSALAGAINMVFTEPLWRACVVAQAQADGPSLPLQASEGSPARHGARQGVFSIVFRCGPRKGHGRYGEAWAPRCGS